MVLSSAATMMLLFLQVKCKAVTPSPSNAPTSQEKHQEKDLGGVHHSPTGQAADLPAAQILHGFGVHGGLAGGVGGTPEKQAACKPQKHTVRSVPPSSSIPTAM